MLIIIGTIKVESEEELTRVKDALPRRARREKYSLCVFPEPGKSNGDPTH